MQATHFLALLLEPLSLLGLLAIAFKLQALHQLLLLF
jgi:hypothetical protein